MPRMIDAILQGTAPQTLIRRAARGELSLPPAEAIEILVALTGDRELGEEAEKTLQGWDESSLAELAASPETPETAWRYLLQNSEAKPAVITALCDNPSVPLSELENVPAHAGVATLKAMVRSHRVRNSSRLLELISENPSAAPVLEYLRQWQSTAENSEAEQVVADFLAAHAEELKHEEHKAFELVSAAEGEEDPLEKLMQKAKSGAAPAEPEEKEQLSVLQRIGRMTVGERIKLAVRGNREERMILIRDRSKLVSLAVLESPKINDSEMEAFAAMKNVQEAVLRTIAGKRNYMKNYGVLRTLVSNPKTPLDVTLPLLPHLLVKDTRALSVNKNVNETLRKMALKLFRTKTERKKE
jgi:hypothetical protein